ncbi:FAD-binding oxidoreductase [Franzmannia qiaohouensis]|uniref:FAD-binding oxidoreductase n=1 Tax=Franzmannia qiaohouensis TaxID=1329370 RepID=A0ABU1HFH7_9GAMM|nr:FAD-binding oxidoreductase [Halomonas qiaohouensis]MDR5906219.1 FAD-binding oxidoreductase [Halomonas qiaohouensis]
MDDLLKEIAAIVGDAHVLTGEAVTARAVDWMTGAPCRAAAIVRPACTEDVAAVMRACYAARQPVVTHGGLTGLVHGAEADGDELVISLERMAAIEALDPVGATLTVQAGAPLQRVQEAAEQAGLQFALDLGARGSCTIGGNIATNAGGIRVIRYGMMRHQVLGLEAVLADGSVVSSMNHMLKNNAGYDLKQLFIGSEGTLGIVTRAVLRLQPPTPAVETALVACSTFSALTGLLGHLGRALGGSLAAFEAMWQSHYRLLTVDSQRHVPPLEPDAPFYAIVESLGSDPDSHAAQFAQALEAALDQELIGDAVLAHSDTQRQGLWAIREDIEGLIHGLSPLFTFDVSLPIAEMEGYVSDVEAAIHRDWPAGRVVTFGHLGDGNLHLSVGVGSQDPATRRAVEQHVYAPLAALGGSVSAEHGIGLEKRDYLHLSRTPDEIALMRTLKQALDPHGLLNRHKVLTDTRR